MASLGNTVSIVLAHPAISKIPTRLLSRDSLAPDLDNNENLFADYVSLLEAYVESLERANSEGGVFEDEHFRVTKELMEYILTILHCDSGKSSVMLKIVCQNNVNFGR